MQPGGENHVRGGQGKPQYAPAQRAAGDPQVKQVQQGLNRLKLTGADGKPLAEDGIRGKNTNFAIQSFKTEYKMPQANDAMVMYYIINPSQNPNKGYAGGVAPTQQPAQQAAPSDDAINNYWAGNPNK
jgi:peptidoglycan hydrolase-like protein with peptidoglycan-binding domain